MAPIRASRASWMKGRFSSVIRPPGLTPEEVVAAAGCVTAGGAFCIQAEGGKGRRILPQQNDVVVAMYYNNKL